MELNKETITKLLDIYRGDSEALEMIEAALLSIEEYHVAIYEMEIKKVVLTALEIEASEYRSQVEALDRNRTVHHNAMLTQVNILNRMASMNDLAPVYGGTVSEDKPYRRQVADAALAFARQVIVERP